MKLLRYLKVLSGTIGAVAAVGALMIFVFVPREALVDYLPALQGILPAPEEKPEPVESKAPVVTVVQKPKPAVALLEKEPESTPPDDESVQPLSEQSPEPSEQLIEVAAGEVDWDDSGTLEKITEKATDLDELQVRRQRGVETASDKDGPFTGWAKKVWAKNGQLEELGRYEDGLREGLWVEWAKDGRKEKQGHYKNGRQDGLWTQWKSNGVIAKEYTYVNGKKGRQPVRKRMDERRLKWREVLEERDRLKQERLPRK